MSQWVLVCSGHLVPMTTLCPLTVAEQHSPTEQRKQDEFDQQIRSKLGDSLSQMDPEEDPPHVNVGNTMEPYEDEEEVSRTIPEADNYEYDSYVSMELSLPHHHDSMQRAKVLKYHRNSNGKTQGKAHDNPILDTCVYDVQFNNGSIKQYSTNVIAENMLSQVDGDGYASLLLDEIIGHRTDGHVIPKEEKYINTKGGRKLCKTTIGWYLHALWKDGSMSWIPLKELKEANPVETAEYAIANGIQDEAVYIWWVPYIICKQDLIIAAVNKRVCQTNYKYGHKVPRSVKEALQFDKENEDHRWRDAIAKEMGNVIVAFKILEDSENMPVGFTKAYVHMIFDVKMTGEFKARLVKDDHKTPDPDSSQYVGVLSRDSVRIALLYAALNDIDVICADIRNAYLQVASSEKHYIV